MTIKEAVHEQQQAMKSKPAQERLSYFWQYHGIKTIVILVCLSLIIFLGSEILTQKEQGYIGIFFGATANASSSSYLSAFMEFSGIDAQTQEVAIQSMPAISLDGPITEEFYQTIQSFSTMFTTNTVDSFCAESSLFLYYSYLHYSLDLRTVLNEAELSTLAPYLHYIDGELLSQYDAANEGTTLDFHNFPNSKCPEAMADPIPVAIDLVATTEAFRNAYTFSSNTAIIGICTTTERMDKAVAFLRYIFDL